MAFCSTATSKRVNLNNARTCFIEMEPVSNATERVKRKCLTFWGKDKDNLLLISSVGRIQTVRSHKLWTCRSSC